MCLAVPHEIIKILDENRAIAAAGPVEVEIRTDMVSDISIGDKVLVHAGFAIEKLQGSEGEEICSLWEELREVMENENASNRK
ncbi:hydrogenase assembly chaperone hypC/hupF [Thermovirga lienii DSM 17291]|jgi:hydrogenase expression/formation protein HypC|uniref:Hydrogenase assembly chaperone hypC/hupF n=1 Tax=Thermovirga lienii (strain ATCC BAA-1197 / DSM 17291 / Cas60314) TaxID=580340 RepID=G7V639_THELD|nr:HypC/HybG/HupF family hydrogenase formation chaperone [Thermovirga lienii]AER67026.1 hydrogenase assembly chaperone hypC/hupF [Thermovirga lienii DSM 17291]MDN5367740.1 hydrogenase expression/formation protein HypC [Thermovirga sp.]